MLGVFAYVYNIVWPYLISVTLMIFFPTGGFISILCFAPEYKKEFEIEVT